MMCKEFKNDECVRCGKPFDVFQDVIIPKGENTKISVHGTPYFRGDWFKKIIPMMELLENQKQWMRDYNNNSRIILKPSRLRGIGGKKPTLIMTDDVLEDEDDLELVEEEE